MFLSKEVGEIDREAILFFRIERSNIPVDRKLNPCFDSYSAVDTEDTWPKKYLCCLAVRQVGVLSLKRP